MPLTSRKTVTKRPSSNLWAENVNINTHATQFWRNMNYEVDDPDGKDFTIMPLLRERLSSSVINWLQRLTKPTFPPAIFQTGSSELKPESLESLLNVLLIEQVFERNGHLISLPLFFELPAIVQVRLLFIMQTNISWLAHHTLTTFCNKIERSPNIWVQELVQQLKPHLMQNSLFKTLTSPLGSHTEQQYQLSPETREHFKDLLSDLKKKKNNPLSNSGGTTDIDWSIQEKYQLLTKENMSNFVDVIIIDEDDDDSCRPDVDEMQRSGNVLNIKHASMKTNMHHSVSLGSLRKDYNTDISEDVVGEGDKSSLVFMQSLKEDVKVNLAILREACKSDNKEVNTDMLHPLSELSISEMKEACEFLELDQLTDKKLVIMFDNMPWADLSLTAANILLNSCLIPKLTNMETECSHLMLEAVISVASTQPKILTDVLVLVLRLSLSGMYQCQFVSAVIKQSLPLDTLGYFIGKLDQESVTANEHLLGVLQTVLDRKPELDPDTLNQLFTLLAMGSNGQNSNITLGKILLAVLSRYGKRMSSKHITMTMACTIIDSHTSNLKRSLQKAIKKIL